MVTKQLDLLLARKEKSMKYKEFNDWCNRRASDGCWGLREAMVCLEACSIFSSVPFWKREKMWKEYENRELLEKVVADTDRIIEKVRQGTVF